MKLFSETVNTNPEENTNEKVNEYDQPVSQEEISGLREKVEEDVRNKASELNISEEKLIELASLDLESLDKENLESLDLNQGGLEFIRGSVDRAINEFWRSEKTGKLVTGTTSKIEGSINEAFEFAKKHKEIVSLGELALYASSYGAPALNFLAEEDVKVEFKGQEISLKDLEKNPEFIVEIDRISSHNSPVDILERYPSQSFSYPSNNQDDVISFSIFVENEINKNGDMEKTVSFSFNNLLSEEKINEIKNDLENVGIKFNAPKTTAEGKGIETIDVSLGYFIENKEQVAKVIANNFNVSESEVGKYIDNQTTPDTSKVLVVELNDFNINKNIESADASKINQTLNQKWIEIKNNNFEKDKPSAETNAKSLSEFIEWFKQSDYENVNGVDVDNVSDAYEIILEKEKVGTALKEFRNLQELEKNNFNEYEDNDKFKELFLELLEKDGYSIEDLKKIAEDNPEKVIKIISEVIEKRIEYDEERNEKREKGNISFQTPNLTLEKESGICVDYAEALASAKYILEKEGVPNFDKFVILTTHSIEMDHEWNILVTVDSNNNLVISFIDLTYHDSGGELNAVDEEHYYKRMEKLAIESIQKAMEKFAFQENLKKILTQYDPKHKSEIKVDQEAFELITKRKKDVNSSP